MAALTPRGMRNPPQEKLQGAAPPACGENGQRPLGVDAETAVGIAVDEHVADLIEQLLFHAEVKFPDIHSKITVFRFIQNQFEVRAVSAAGTLFDTDRAIRLASPERLQIVEDGVGQGNHVCLRVG